MAGMSDWHSSSARYMRGEISVQDYMMASSDEEDADLDSNNESASETEDSDDESYESSLPKRLRRLFKTEDIRNRYGHDWAELPWALISMEWGDEWGTGDMVSPPPPNDPRTHLPKIFKFHGWDFHKLPDFTVRDPHPPQYPSDLVSRLRELHDSGVALQKQDGVEYVVMCRNWEDVEDETSDEDDDEDEASNDEESDDDDEGGTVVERYETLEQANDRVMEEVESEHRAHMQYRESEPDDDCPQEVGLYSFVHKDQEDSLEFYPDEGLTWDIDNNGCLMFHWVAEEWVEYVVEKRTKSTGPRKEPRRDRPPPELPANQKKITDYFKL